MDSLQSGHTDPLGGSFPAVDVEFLPRWSDEDIPNYYNEPSLPAECQFPYRGDLNKKIVLWDGDITQINTTAIVHSTNEAMTDRNPISEKMFQIAGPALRVEVKQEVKGCRTGEARITKAHQLPSRFVIHTVGPRYNVKYRTAAESALYNCYRSVLRIVREKGLNSVTLCNINSVRRGYPPEEGAHIAIRTVRRFLEKFGDTIETVVFCTIDVDVEIYRKLLPLYFPRSETEEKNVFHLLPEDIGNEEGEPVIAERQIRILDNPTVRGHDGDPEYDDSININEEFEATTVVGRSSFARMESDHDQKRQQQLIGKTSQEVVRLEQERRYQRWLKRARIEDLSAVAGLRFLYQAGVDRFGRPVVIVVGRNFPAKSIDMEKIVLYMIHVLDPIVTKNYVIVYVHTLTTSQHRPELGFLKQVYHFVDHKYKKNLKAFYILHPTFWSKVTTWFFTTFTASSIKDKVHSLPSIRSLYEKIEPNQIALPDFVMEYDLKINGAQYAAESNAYNATIDVAGEL